MDLYKFKDNLIAKLESHLFLWDSNWECFRPITNIGWNGFKIEIDDYKFKQDLFSENYGFGDFKDVCNKLDSEIDLSTFKIIDDLNILSKNVEFFKDRKIPFLNSCTSKSTSGWLKYLKFINQRQKTLRKIKNNVRVTKRLLRK